MNIRKATPEDEINIMKLLDQLGYPATNNFLREKIIRISNNPDAELLVYEMNNNVVAFIAIDFICQLGLEGDFARISYFAVDHAHRSKGIGKEMEEYCVALATRRKCDRIELHCSAKRTDAIRFYKQQGYCESPKYLMKMIRKPVL